MGDLMALGIDKFAIIGPKFAASQFYEGVMPRLRT
jgi:hypothetical protein